MHYRYLLGNLVMRDIKVKYRRSALGLVWSVLNPLLMMLVMVLVFGTLFKDANTNGAPLVSTTGQPPAFATYLISGQLIFNFFSEATQLAMDSVLGNAPLIKKVYIPKYIFPLEKVIFSLVNTLFSFISLAIVIFATGSPLTLWALLFPIPLILLFIFNLGIGLVLSCLVVFFRDIKHLYGVFVLALTYMTPIFYTEAIWKSYSFVTYVAKLNPMYWYVNMFRQFVVYGRPADERTWFATVACAVIALAVGLFVFRKRQDKFILYI